MNPKLKLAKMNFDPELERREKSINLQHYKKNREIRVKKKRRIRVEKQIINFKTQINPILRTRSTK